MDTARVFIARNRLNLAFGLGGFASAILGTLFGLFNVILFTNVVKLRPSYFYTGHILYGLWNAVNDPAFGWLLDRTANKSNRRLPVIYIGGPAWCLCFMLTWYPWSYDGDSYLAFSHFLFTMFCYDGFLTYVLIVKCALLADLCTDSKARNQLNTFSAWFELLGSSLALLGYYFFDEDNLGPFRKICWVMSSLAALAWYMSGKMMLMPKTVSYLPVKTDDCEPLDFPKEIARGPSKTTPSKYRKEQSQANTWTQEFGEWWIFAKQLFQQKNFVLYVSMNWMMNFNVSLSSSFFVFCNKLLMKTEMPSEFYYVVTTMCLYLPKVGVQVLAPFADKLGLYYMIKWVKALLIGVGILALMVGSKGYYVWGILLVLQMFLFRVWGFYDLVMADVIDEDRLKHRRKESVATSVHGVHALIVKPSQSLAPVLGVFLLNTHGLQNVSEDEPVSPELREAIFNLTFGAPFVCSILQYIIWNYFSLRDEYLVSVKKGLEDMKKVQMTVRTSDE